MKNRLHVVAAEGDGGRKAALAGGLAEWLLAAVRQWREGARTPRRKQMNVVETLALGAKEQAGAGELRGRAIPCRDWS